MSLADVDNSIHCSDATETLEDSAVVEKVMELARRYAAGMPSEKEFKTLKQRLLRMSSAQSQGARGCHTQPAR